MSPPPREVTVEQEIVRLILHDLTGRRGLCQEWEGIDDDIQAEIVAKWESLAAKALAAESSARPAAEWVAFDYRSGKGWPQEGELVLWAVRCSGDSVAYFADAMVYDAETSPDWREADHDWSLDDVTAWMPIVPLPPPPPVSP